MLFCYAENRGLIRRARGPSYGGVVVALMHEVAGSPMGAFGDDDLGKSAQQITDAAPQLAKPIVGAVLL